MEIGGPPMEGFLTDASGSKEKGKEMAALFIMVSFSRMKLVTQHNIIPNTFLKVLMMVNMKPMNLQLLLEKPILQFKKR